MTEPAFFIPNVDEAKVEEAYAIMAKYCGRPMPSVGERIYSITFKHDGVDWTATVGETLKGIKYVMNRGRETRQPHSDQATVIAIFPGTPYVVFTSKGPTFGADRSTWENPFWAGEPRTIRRFS